MKYTLKYPQYLFVASNAGKQFNLSPLNLQLVVITDHVDEINVGILYVVPCKHVQCGLMCCCLVL